MEVPLKRLMISVFALATIGFTLMSAGSRASSASTTGEPFTFDVAIDSRTYVVNRVDPEAESIVRGDTFVISGKIFPGGTIPTEGTASEPSSFGPDSEGAVGDWICRGTYLVDADQLETAKMQRLTTQYFLLPNTDRIITEGFESVSSVTRIVTGGVRVYNGAGGSSVQTNLGINETGAYNVRFEFTLQ